MKYSYLYRIGTIEDLEQLQQLRVLSYGQFQNNLTPENWKAFKEKTQVRQRLIDLLTLATCFVCQYNDEIIGMAFIVSHNNPTDVFISEWAYIKMVGVSPNHQGQGIARKLMEMCIDFARKNNEKTIALTTSEFMVAAKHIYESMGFEMLKEIQPQYGKKYGLYTLELA